MSITASLRPVHLMQLLSVCSVLKKSQSPPQPPQPRPSASFSEKRWSSAPSKPSTTLDISGPLIEDPPSYDSYVRDARVTPSLPAPPPSAPSRPIFKPSANKPSALPAKPHPPTARPTPLPPPAAAAAAPVPAVAIAGRDRKSFLGASTAAPTPHQTVGDKSALGSATETNSQSRLLPVISVASESTLKRQQRRREDRPTQSPPTSPTKGDRKVAHSQSLQEPHEKEQLGTREKVVKRESFRGAEISNPILVSTTNRDSQVFADFELDQSGIVARPVSKQHSVHGSNPASEGARDGCRSPIRRSQSDRPLSPKRFGGTADATKKTAPQAQGFTPRPLPPEPVLETEPLYINEDLSDLGDLEAQISSAFEGIKLDVPATNSSAAGTVKTTTASKPAASVSSSVLDRASRNPASSASSSSSSSAKPTASSKAGPVRPTPGPARASSKPSESGEVSGRKSTPLDRVLSNPIKSPFGAGAATSSPASSTSAEPSKGPTAAGSLAGGKTPATASSGSKPSSAAAPSSAGTVRGPLGSYRSKGSNSVDTGKEPAGSTVSQGPAASAAGKAPSTTAASNRGPSLNAVNKGATPNTAAGKAPPLSAVGRGAAPSQASKGPTHSTSGKVPTASNSATGRGSSSGLSSTTNKPVVGGKFSATSAPAKGPASSASSVRGPATTNSSGASKVAGVAGAPSKPGGRGAGGGANLQRSESGASRPAVAPKPGAGKSVRSYNF